jgi:hypothetical protein
VTVDSVRFLLTKKITKETQNTQSAHQFVRWMDEEREQTATEGSAAAWAIENDGPGWNPRLALALLELNLQIVRSRPCCSNRTDEI